MIVVWSEKAENTLKKTAEYILEKFVLLIILSIIISTQVP